VVKVEHTEVDRWR